MRDALRRVPLERAIQVSIVVTILGAMLATGALLDWLAFGRKLRWVGLLALVALAGFYAWSRGTRFRPAAPYLLAAAVATLAVASAAWSADPRSSIARGGAFALVLAAAALLAAAGGSRGAVAAVLVAIAIVALGGLVVLALAPDRAVQAATPREPARYQGLGGNPNSATLLLAFGLPLAAAAAARARSAGGRAALVAVGVLCAGSIVASGSRGALSGGFAGLAVTVALLTRTARARLVGVAAVLAAAVLAAAATELPQPDPDAVVPRARDVGPATTGNGFINAEATYPLEDELGRPPPGTVASPERATLLGSSGRVEAWEWSVRHALERPVAGYGFGAEDEAFVDRFAAVQADTPENTYVGLFLQLGLAGTAVFAAALAAIAAASVAGVRRSRVAAGCAGAVACGLTLAFAQSFVYAPGGVATLAFWIAAFALVGLAEPR